MDCKVSAARRAHPAPLFLQSWRSAQRASSSTLRWLALSAGRRVLGAGQARELRAALGPPAPLVRHLRAAARGRHRRRQQALRGLPKEAAELWHAGRAEGALVRARAAPRAAAANPRPPLRCHGCSQKHPGAENVVSKRCEECKNKQPSYGMPSDNKQRWCQPCSTKHPGAINLVGKKKGGQRGTTPPSPSSQNHPAEPNPSVRFLSSVGGAGNSESDTDPATGWDGGGSIAGGGRGRGDGSLPPTTPRPRARRAAAGEAPGMPPSISWTRNSFWVSVLSWIKAMGLGVGAANWRAAGAAAAAALAHPRGPPLPPLL